jgi:hypothetical protein
MHLSHVPAASGKATYSGDGMQLDARVGHVPNARCTLRYGTLAEEAPYTSLRRRRVPTPRRRWARTGRGTTSVSQGPHSPILSHDDRE